MRHTKGPRARGALLAGGASTPIEHGQLQHRRYQRRGDSGSRRQGPAGAPHRTVAANNVARGGRSNIRWRRPRGLARRLGPLAAGASYRRAVFCADAIVRAELDLGRLVRRLDPWTAAPPCSSAPARTAFALPAARLCDGCGELLRPTSLPPPRHKREEQRQVARRVLPMLARARRAAMWRRRYGSAWRWQSLRSQHRALAFWRC